MKKQMKNKAGKAMSSGTILLIGLILVGVWLGNIGGVQDFFESDDAPIVTTKCPSSGFTEWTLNAEEALASTSTNANVSYYIYDGNTMVKNGDTGSDGTVSVDLECGVGKTYTGYIVNEAVNDGFYPQTITIDASGPTHTSNLEMYQFGTVDVASVVSSADPTGAANISSGTGKNCGFTVTFSENESAAAYNNPILLVLVNSTAVTDITMTGVTEVPNKFPQRISTLSGLKFYVFQYDGLLKSTDAAVKVNGKIKFSSSATIPTANTNNLSVMIVDEAPFSKAGYKTLSLSDGFVLAAENTETIADIGGADSDRETVAFAGTYC